MRRDSTSDADKSIMIDSDVKKSAKSEFQLSV